MNKGNIKGLVIMAVASVVVIAAANPVYTALKGGNAAAAEGAVTATGEADGFGGKITAEVTTADGKIVAVKLTGEAETPEIGGKALPELEKAIVEAGAVDGIDAIAGATISSNGAFDAVKAALEK